MDNVEYKCLECHKEINAEDNFCYSCGSITAHGYKYLDNSIKTKDNNTKLKTLIILLSLSIFIFVPLSIIRGQNLYKPFAYLEKQINYYKHGYNTTLLKTNNTYENIDITSLEDAQEQIYNDFDNQFYLCKNNLDIKRIEYELETKYDITSINFCDLSIEKVNKISQVIEKIYELFPNIKGSLTNITLTNSLSQGDYVAYFQPRYEFINSNQDISSYNKVNKTQILLNSYYFLNDKTNEIDLEKYVKDAYLESTIAHELGHYITFKSLLKSYNLDSITLVTSDNEEKINEVINGFDTFCDNVLNIALQRYNNKYNTNLDLNNFALNISKYAGIINENNKLIASETIAEAIHDYFLHGNNLEKESQEIVDVIKENLR